MSGLAAVVALMLASDAGSGRAVVELKVPAYHYFEPATVRLTVVVAPDERNRTLRVEADGDSFFRAAEASLMGAKDKRFHTVEFRNVPSGVYVLRAEVLSTDAVLGSATQSLSVNP
jgi:hypothetical protein